MVACPLSVLTFCCLVNDKQPTVSSSLSDYEKLLHRLILQFTLLCRQIDPALDTSMKNLTSQLKAGFDRQKMHALLNQLSLQLKSVITKQSQVVPGATLLFDYLAQVSSPEQAKGLKHVRQRYENKEFNSVESLFSALKIALKPEKTASDKTVATASPDARELMLRQINQLFDALDVPAKLNQRVNLFKQRAQSALNEGWHDSVMEEGIKLLLNIREYVEKEQQRIDRFLTGLVAELIEVSAGAEQLALSAEQTLRDQQIFNSQLGARFHHLNDQAASLQNLTDVRNVLANYLDEINHQLTRQNDALDDRQANTLNQLDEMRCKLQALENEAEILRMNLKLAHDRAMHDPLTGLPNRRAYIERRDQEVARWQRYRQPLSLLIWDIDWFKRINDRYGHKSGDRALVLVGQLLLNNCRETDFVARYGGEEFVMLLPNTEAENALVLAEAIRTTIANTGFHFNGEAVELTVSCGISEFRNGDHQEAVFERADQALYQAKQSGRNRCVIKNT